jgi:small subunit ribosomal protein S25e
LGGAKKKPLAKAERGQTGEEEEKPQAPKKKESKREQVSKQVSQLIPRFTDEQAIQALSPLKAITIYGAARALGVKASIANTILKSLRSKDLLRKEGGYSGHYVYAINTSGKEFEVSSKR